MQANDPLTNIFRLTDQQKAALRKLHTSTARDLLFHFPFRYDAPGEESTIAGLEPGMQASVIGVLERMETKRLWKSRVPATQGYIRDATGRIKCTWFNQPYIGRLWQDGTPVKATGKVSGTSGKLYLANPELSRASNEEATNFQNQTLEKLEQRPDINFSGSSLVAPRSQLFAVYPESSGVTSLWIRHAVEKVLNQKGGLVWNLQDPLPAGLLKRYNLPTLGTALVWIHAPQTLKDAAAARKRFAFEEVFFIQLARQRERAAAAREKSFVVDPPKGVVGEFVESFPFAMTRAQERAINAILADMKRGAPMSRLLEGDVGSGKTAVAATACFAAVSTRPSGQSFGTLQAAYMAPTEILARQHFDSFIALFRDHPLPIGLITSSGCLKFPSKINREKPTPISRAQLLKWVANGEIPLLIGTHALIQEAVRFKHLALVIIDEQHRFGTNQRRALAHKEERIPHLLSMTATPIPRTLALTVYGDLDLTLLDEMPTGRKPIITEIVAPAERPKAYEKMRNELQSGKQAYVICPRIDEPDPGKLFALQAKSVKEEAKRLKKDVFHEYEIAILHSKMTPKEKSETMQKFVANEIQILVATSVVEVGVNIPNATLIMIEGAERFGLAQLHQLRGRVVRSSAQAYCFVCAESRGARTLARLRALATAKSGFELAEFDLRERGAGELGGGKQWGISDIGMEALQNLKLVEAARQEAVALIQADENLAQHPLLSAELARRTSEMHFE